MEENIIQIGFFPANSCFQKYGHVEVRFSDGTSTSITRDSEYVHLLPKTLVRYSCFFQVAISQEMENEMMIFASEYPKKFSTFTMYWNFIFKKYPIRRGTFCSEYICCLLQLAGFCQNMDSYVTTPDDLYNELRFDARVYCSRNSLFKSTDSIARLQ
jgi:hypothetical protein